jgi:type VI secretion system protein ImpC
MSAAWAYASRVTDAYAKDGWFMRTRGAEGGGKVVKCPTEVLIPDRRENELSGLGFLPLCHYKNTDHAVFFGAATCNKPATYRGDTLATSNAALSANLSYMMCVSRFAHYLKVIARDKIGSMMEEFDMRKMLNDWINTYVCDPTVAGEEIRAKNPLSAAEVEVSSVPGKPGFYRAIARLRPHFQFEGLNASMRLVAELPHKK